MSKAKIFYFTLQDEQTKEEKLDWFDRTRFEQIPFDHTYKFADDKEHVADLLQRVCTVSVKTIEIIQQMPDTVEYKRG